MIRELGRNKNEGMSRTVSALIKVENVCDGGHGAVVMDPKKILAAERLKFGLWSVIEG